MERLLQLSSEAERLYDVIISAFNKSDCPKEDDKEFFQDGTTGVYALSKCNTWAASELFDKALNLSNEEANTIVIAINQTYKNRRDKNEQK